MKEATGELNMTVVTIIAIGAIVAFFWVMWPKIQNTINNTWDGIDTNVNCGAGQYYNGTQCVTE